MTALDTSQPSPSARIDQDDLERFSISDTASTRWRDRDTPSSESIIVIDQSRSEGRESQHSISNSSFSKTKLHSIQPPRLKGLKEFWKSWGLEIGALALSIGSTLTITAVLFSWDTQPLTDWHFVTSLNTVISTLGAIARISLAFAISACIGQQKWNWFRIRQDRLKTFERFDEASRGPWGSFILLCTLWKRPWLALGALTTIIIIAFDPFLQAIVNYSGRLDATATALGNLPRTDRLDVGSVLGSQYYDSSQIYNLRSPFDLTISQPDNGIQAAVYNGFNNGTIPAIPFSCSSGNCTWPVFTTLGVCSECHDISQKMTLVDTRMPAMNVHGHRLPDTRRYELPYVTLANVNGSWEHGDYELAMPQASGIFLTANTTYNFTDTVSFQNFDTMLMAMAIIKAPKGYVNQSQRWEHEPPTATECAIWICAKALQVSSKEGVLKEQVLETWRQRSPHSWIQQMLPKKGAGKYYNMTVKQDLSGSTLYQTFDSPRTDLQIVVPDSYSPLPSDQTGKFYPRGNLARQFNISQNTIISTIDFLRNWSSATDSEYKTLTYSILMNNPDFYKHLDLTTVLFWTQNTSIPFRNLAQALSNQIRLYGSFPQDGTVQAWVLHFDVSWTFVILPATALVLGCVYVAVIIVETSRLRLPAWKEGIFATLASGVDDEVKRSLREAESQGRKDFVARRTMLELGDEGVTGDGLRLRATS